MEWEGKRYHAAKEPGLKLVVDAGFSCPHGRCTFCDNAAFHPSYSTPSKSITQQLDEGIAFHAARGRAHGPYLAYFQSFSNTFAPLSRLQEAGEALAHPAVSGLVIGTRPDCVDAEKLDYIASLGCARIEYGIESCRDKTLLRVHRGHDFACAERAVRETAAGRCAPHQRPPPGRHQVPPAAAPERHADGGGIRRPAGGFRPLDAGRVYRPPG